jgi:hypothetical protein
MPEFPNTPTRDANLRLDAESQISSTAPQSHTGVRSGGPPAHGLQTRSPRMNQAPTSDTRTRLAAPAQRPAYVRLDPASESARAERLRLAASQGWTLTQCAAAEGISVQALDAWVNRRPAYADTVAHRRRGPKAVLTPVEFDRRLAAVRMVMAGARWKAAAWPIGVSAAALCSWYYKHRHEIDARLASGATASKSACSELRAAA